MPDKEFRSLPVLCAQEITVCRIGCGVVLDARDVKPVGSGQKIGRIEDSKSKTQLPSPVESKSKSLWSRMSFRRSSPDISTDCGSELSSSATLCNMMTTLRGQLAEVAVFMEPLLDIHIQALFRLGKNVSVT